MATDVDTSPGRTQLDAEGEMLQLKGAIRAVGRLMSNLGGKGVEPEAEDLFYLMETLGAQAGVVEAAYRQARAVRA